MSNLNGIKVGNTVYGFGANELVSPALIDGIPFDGGDSVVHYAVCSTAAGTAAKTATIGNDFELETGSRVAVKFTNANSSSSPTLNINGTGAKAIILYGSTTAGSGAWNAGETVEFIYDGTRWTVAGSTYAAIGAEKTRAEAAEALLAPKASPNLTGTPTAPTATAGTNTTQIATTEFVQQTVSPVEAFALGAYPTESETGTIASTMFGADAIQLKQFLVSIDAIWKGSGTPATDNIRGIVGFTGVTITRARKNLLDPSIFADTTESDGVYTKGSEYAELNHGNAIFLPAGSYVCSFNNPGGNFSKVSWTTVSGAVGEAPFTVSVPGDGYTTCSFTLAEAAYVYVRAGACSFSEPQLEAGSARSDYAPYNGNAYAVSWQDEVGTIYGGTLDVLTGVLTVTNWGHTFDGTEEFTYYSNQRLSLNWFFPEDRGVVIGGSQTKRIPYSSHYPAGTQSQYTEKYCQCLQNTSGKMIFVRPNADGDEGTVSIDSFKSYLSAQYAAQTPVQLAWTLKDPVTYQLTATDVESLLGENQIFASTGDVDVTYRCDPTLFINGKIAALTALISES